MSHDLEDILILEMRCGLMYSGYATSGTTWWARNVGFLLPHSLLPPLRIPAQQTTPVANCSPIHPEPLSPVKPGSPRCAAEKAAIGERLQIILLFAFVFYPLSIIPFPFQQISYTRVNCRFSFFFFSFRLKCLLRPFQIGIIKSYDVATTYRSTYPSRDYEESDNETIYSKTIL